MDNKDELVSKLLYDLEKQEYKIEHIRITNIRNYIVRILLKTGIGIDYALPFILATFIVIFGCKIRGKMPFYIDDVTEHSSVETIDTSNGIHLKKYSYDFEYDDSAIKYSTGWITNKNGLFERTETSYKINSKIDLSDINKVFDMSKKEIESMLEITNIQTICKKHLTPEDDIYNTEAIIIINHDKSDSEYRVRKETGIENVGYTILSIIWICLLGMNFINLEKVFVKRFIRDKLREYEPLYRNIDKNELETIKKIIELKKQNLAMLDESNSNNYSYKLRRMANQEIDDFD